MTLHEIYLKHGFPVKVRAQDKVFGPFPFTMLEWADENRSYAKVRYEDGKLGVVDTEVPWLNDYEAIS